MTLKISETTVFTSTQIKGDVIGLNSFIVGDDEHPEAIIANVLLKLFLVVFFEVIRDIHPFTLLSRVLAQLTRL
jgi:hypothetical protein